MAVDYTFDPDLGLLAIRYSGLLASKEIVEAIPGMGRLLGRSRSYTVLMIFEDDVDLSLIDFSGLESIKQEAQAVIRHQELDRRASAAVVGRNVEPRLLIPLWNAICAIDLDPAFQVPVFSDLDRALAELGVSPAQGRTLVDRLPPKEPARG